MHERGKNVQACVDYECEIVFCATDPVAQRHWHSGYSVVVNTPEVTPAETFAKSLNFNLNF